MAAICCRYECAQQVTPFIQAWLDNQDRGQAMDFDGDLGKGFRLYNEKWGHVAGWYQAFLAVEAVWAYYSK